MIINDSVTVVKSRQKKHITRVPIGLHNFRTPRSGRRSRPCAALFWTRPGPSPRDGPRPEAARNGSMVDEWFTTVAMIYLAKKWINSGSQEFQLANLMTIQRFIVDFPTEHGNFP